MCTVSQILRCSISPHLAAAQFVSSVLQILTGGNVLLFVSEQGVRVFDLARYVVKRDPMGNVLEIITKETVAHNVLDENVDEGLFGETDESLVARFKKETGGKVDE